MNDIEIAIQKRVDAEVGKKLISVLKRVASLQAAVDKLHDDLTALTDNQPTGPLANGAAKEKKPRAPIAVDGMTREAIFGILRKTPGHAFTIGEIKADIAVEASGRTIGAALRSFVAKGEAIEVKGGKFQVKETPADAAAAEA